ncbi:DNA-binding transcriptional LysR family regulator [Acinetobacter calcoaceticus]|uniref:DNA-binding transcriptional LysR family regulator n=1 Tax=Acinetobacter calcoaceticus TaxID=471 RepID=A0A4R1XHZ3_ACICA|nr:DNA-binding transcriptional LysR family regulator [Acinetobacter calcoaceticus]
MSTLKQFNYLIRIVEDGGFIAASEKLFIAQSALSRQMKLLEDELGFAIFDRSEKKAKLTEAGQLLYKNLKNHVLHIQSSIELAQANAKGEGRTVYVAHSSSVIFNQAKISILNQLSEACAVEIEINTFSSEHQLTCLLNGSIDIGFIRPPVFHDYDHIHAQTLYSAPLYLAVNRHDANFKQRDNVDIIDLAEQKFVAIPHGERGGLSYLAANLCLSKGFFPQKARMRSRKISTLDLVEQGLGVCIVPEEYGSVLPPNVKLITIENDQHHSEVLLIWRKDYDPLIQRCAEMLLDRFSKSKMSSDWRSLHDSQS